MRGDMDRARGCLLNLDKSLELLSQSESEHDTVFLRQMMPRALHCAVACYTMLGNLFFLEAKKVLSQAQHHNANPASFKDASFDKALHLSSTAFRHAVKLRKREGRDPGFGHILLGEVLVAQGRFVEATSQFEEALGCAVRYKWHFNNADEVFIIERRNLGDMWLIRNNYSAALVQYMACARGMAMSIRRLTPPEDGCAHSRLGRHQNENPARGQQNPPPHMQQPLTWTRDLLTQASIMTTIAMCLRALGQLDQAKEIIGEAESLVRESAALTARFSDKPLRDDAAVTTGRKLATASGGGSKHRETGPGEASSKSGGGGGDATASTPQRHVRWEASVRNSKSRHGRTKTPKRNRTPAPRLDASFLPASPSLHKGGPSGNSTTMGEVAAELLVRCGIERAHTHLRAGKWRRALALYNDAEQLLNLRVAEINTEPIMKTKQIHMIRGTLEMFRGDVFAHRLSKVIEMTSENLQDSWMDFREEPVVAAPPPPLVPATTSQERALQEKGSKRYDQKDGGGEGSNGNTATTNNNSESDYPGMSGGEIYSRAVVMYTNAYTFACAHTQMGDPYRVSCLARVGQLHAMCERWERALPVLRLCLKQAQTFLTSMHAQLRASICVAVADVLRHGADPQQREALDLYSQALQLYHESTGAGAIEMGAAYLGIGHIWGSRGEHENSLKYYVASEAVARTHLGEEHPVTLHVRACAAQSLLGIGNAAKAAENIKSIISSVNNTKKTRTATMDSGDAAAGLGAVPAGASGVSSLLYRWYACRPDMRICSRVLAACEVHL